MWATSALQAFRVCSGSTGTEALGAFATVVDFDMFASVDVGDVVGRPNRLDPNSIVFLRLGSQEILGLSGERVFPLITDKI